MDEPFLPTEAVAEAPAEPFVAFTEPAAEVLVEPPAVVVTSDDRTCDYCGQSFPLNEKCESRPNSCCCCCPHASCNSRCSR